ncbi:MAG TPA: hypothetical protein VGE93_02855 [Bryobacteraceae bacterium]
MTPVHLKTPLPAGKQALLTVMDRVARLTNLRYFVVGATARDIQNLFVTGYCWPTTAPPPGATIASGAVSKARGMTRPTSDIRLSRERTFITRLR